VPPRERPQPKNPPAAPPTGPLPPSLLPPTDGPTDIVPIPGPGAVGDVEQAVGAINALYVVGALDTALAIGDHILRVYLGGDEAALAQGTEAPSLRRLADHPGLAFPTTTLWTAIHVYRQYPTLPEDARRRLTFSHHRLLLSVTSAQAKARLANEAVSRRFTTAALEQAINRWLASQHLPPIGGTPLHPALVASKRGANAILRAAQHLEKGEAPTAAERQEIHRQVRLAEKRLERLRAALATRPRPPRRSSHVGTAPSGP
jgi:hypothetical protein